MSFVNLEDITNNEFKPIVRSNLVAAIQSAYELAVKHYNEFDFLNWSVGRNIFTEFRGIVTQFAIVKLIDQKNLGLTYKVSPNSLDNCEHIEILSRKSTLTISQVERKGILPRKAVYRNDLAVTNQVSFDFYNEGINNISRPHRYYFLLTHGSHDDSSLGPDFIYLGLPKPGVRQWEYRINLLMEPYLVDLPVVEDIGSADNLIDLNEFIKKRLAREEEEKNNGPSQQ